MKKTIILLSLLILSSCTQEELIKEFTNQAESNQTETIPLSNQTQNTQSITKPNNKLYKESYLNQRSGISFTWNYQPELWDYMPIFKLNSSFRYFAGGQAYADINNDGFQDIMVSVHQSQKEANVVWFLNKGDNKNFFMSDVKNYFNTNSNDISGFKILKTDVNNDNIADYICLGVEEIPGNYGGNFTILIGNSDNTFNIKKIQTNQRYWYHNGAAGDLNNDGYVDIITANFIWWGDGNGNFKQGISIDASHLSYINSPIVYEIIDINKDGFNDMILSTISKLDVTTIVFGKNYGFDNTNRIVKLPKSTYSDNLDIEFNDLDNDGDLDIIELRHLGGAPDNNTDTKYNVSKLIVYWNSGFKFRLDEEYFSESIDGNYQHGTYDKYGWSSFKFDDVDGDGMDEIVAENYHEGTYNGLKKVGVVWKKSIIKFGK